MSIRNSHIRDSLLFYELLEESESMQELNKNIDKLVDAFRSGICDLCDDKGWDSSDIESDIM